MTHRELFEALLRGECVTNSTEITHRIGPRDKIQFWAILAGKWIDTDRFRIYANCEIVPDPSLPNHLFQETVADVIREDFNGEAKYRRFAKAIINELKREGER